MYFACLETWLWRFLEQRFQIERSRTHVQPPVRSPGPLLLGPVPIKFDAITIGVAEIERFAHAVVRCAFESNACLNQTAQGISKFRAGWINDGHVVKPRRAPMGW